MPNPSHGLTVLQTLSPTMTPKMILEFYDFGVMMRMNNHIYPVDPNQIVKKLQAKAKPPSFSTGLIAPDVIYQHQVGDTLTVISYRAPEYTGVWLEGQTDALRVKLPGLILKRTTIEMSQPRYEIYAVRERPTEKTRLYICPLPNCYAGGGICWGSVPKPKSKDLRRETLIPDFDHLFASSWGSHAIGSKSKKHHSDIRKMLTERNGKKTKYPVSDLIALDQEFSDLMVK